jgi:hypothetical protein
MAELRIQPKKSSPSPWLLVALALVVLAAAAYFFLRPDPAQEPVPATTPVATTSADSLATDTSAARATPPPADDSATTAPSSAAAGTARAKLLQLSDPLTQLTDRSDLREDAGIREQRDNFTSATSRLAEGDPQASLRPGMVAAANLLLAVQQRGYPNLETEANALTLQASQLSGRDATPAEQARNHAYFSQVSTLLNTMSYPARDVL